MYHRSEIAGIMRGTNKTLAYLLRFRFLSCCSRACIFFTILDFNWTQHCWI